MHWLDEEMHDVLSLAVVWEEDDEQRAGKRSKVEEPADHASWVREQCVSTMGRIDAFVETTTQTSRAAWKAYRDFKKAATASARAKVEHPLDGDVEMSGEQVQAASASLRIRQQLHGRAALSAEEDGEAEPDAYHVMRSLLSNKVVQDVLQPCMHSLFSYLTPVRLNSGYFHPELTIWSFMLYVMKMQDDKAQTHCTVL